MLHIRLSKFQFITLCFLFSLIEACQQSHTTKSEAQSASKNSIEIYSSKNTSTQVAIENPQGIVALKNNMAEIIPSTSKIIPGADHAVTRASINSGGGIDFLWSDTWHASLNFSLGAPIDLTSYLKTGVIQFDIRIDQLDKGGVALRRICGDKCERKVPFAITARAIQGQGWKTFSVPLLCFFHDDDSLTSVKDIFSVDTGGAGAVEVNNVRLTTSTAANVSCPNYKTQSVNAEPLNEWWALSWWMPRHEQKLLDIKTRPIDLVFVGDSITEGWEKSGAPVWKKYYESKKAIALGFGGDRTENLLWRLLNGEINNITPKVVVMMIGTNNTGHRMEDPQLISTGIARDIAEIRARIPSAKILLLAIFPRDQLPSEPMRMNNEKVNAIIQGYADNQKVFFLNINSAFLDEKGVLSKEIMPDLLHPNEKGYELWAQAMEPTLARLMK